MMENSHGGAVIILQEPAVRIAGQNNQLLVRRSQRFKQGVGEILANEEIQSAVNDQRRDGDIAPRQRLSRAYGNDWRRERAYIHFLHDRDRTIWL